jgi:UDP-GlcNAc3NAcA epimerase
MKKIVTIIGARPQIIKAAAVSRAIRNRFGMQFEEVIVHTGQHYDANMSASFFDELSIPQPKYNLGVGSGNHGAQTSKMIAGIEEILLIENADFLILYGDTNSTLAGAVAASKLPVAIVHIEAGLRSFNKLMPEEVNRILTDHVSTLLFTPTVSGLKNLAREGFDLNSKAPYTICNPGVFNVGDVMYDNMLFFRDVAMRKATILKDLNIQSEKYVLVTLHRNANTDEASRLNSIMHALLDISEQYETRMVFPVHPRTLKQLDTHLNSDIFYKIKSNPRISIIPPVSFFDMIQLENAAHLIITDSGGVQKEAYFLKKPSIILRSETEWTEIVELGAALLCDADYDRILAAYAHFENPLSIKFQDVYGDGAAAEKILEIMLAQADI